jgi:hypothetical protein
MICARCGGDHVVRDAWASWDVERRTWKLAAVFDYAHCNTCDRETTLRVQAIQPAAACLSVA